jgi:hypothetical protein
MKHYVSTGFEVFTALKMCIVVFWIMIPCSLIGNPEDGGDTFLRNIGNHL